MAAGHFLCCSFTSLVSCEPGEGTSPISHQHISHLSHHRQVKGSRSLTEMRDWNLDALTTVPPSYIVHHHNYCRQYRTAADYLHTGIVDALELEDCCVRGLGSLACSSTPNRSMRSQGCQASSTPSRPGSQCRVMPLPNFPSPPHRHQ